MLHDIILPLYGGSLNLLYGCLKLELMLISNIFYIYMQSMLTRIWFFITFFFIKWYIKLKIYIYYQSTKV